MRPRYTAGKMSSVRNLTRRSVLAGLAASAAAAGSLKLGRRVRVAIIGLDGHPTEITKPLDDIPELDIVAISAKNRAQIERFVRNKPRLANTKAYEDERRMLDAERPDVVAVCNNNGERARGILEAVSRKHHVIAEKPLALNRGDFERVQKAVAEAGVKLGMLLPMRYAPQYRAVKQIVDRGDIGEVIQISAQKSYVLGNREDWYKNEATYGSTILWIAIHMIDLMGWSSGRIFTSAASYMGRVGFPNAGSMETTTATAFRMDNGGAASLHMDYCMTPVGVRGGDDRLRLAGTQGVAEYMAATDAVTLTTQTQKLHRIEALPPDGSVFRDFLAHVYAGAPATLTMEEIYRNCDVTIAAHESAVKGQMVRIG
jgi:predicted dehydrogenase